MKRKENEGGERGGKSKREPKLGSDVISSKKDGRRRRLKKMWLNFRLFFV